MLNPKNLKLPFWLFNFEETVDVFFRGRPGLEEEVEILAQIIPQAKSLFAPPAAARPDAAQGRLERSTGFHRRHARALSAVGPRQPDRRAHGQAREPLLHARNTAGSIARIEAVRKDLRYAFMFDNANVGGDTMVEVLGQLFRLPPTASR